MKSTFIRLAAGRVLLSGVVVAATQFVEHLGVPVPEGFETVTNSLLDAVIVFIAFMIDGKVRDAKG